MDQKDELKDDFLNAIESVEKKHKPKSIQKEKKEKKEKLITVKSIGEYKSNEIAVNVNNFLSKNINEDAGKVLFGENLARTGEYYGLKSTPLWGLLISSISLSVVSFREFVSRKKKSQDTIDGGDLNKIQ